MTAPRPHLALVETAASLPGLFPAAAWEVLQAAERVVARDPDTNPAVPALRAAGFVVEAFEPQAAKPALTGRDLLAAPPTPDAALARGLLELARDRGDVACLLDPDDPKFGREVGLAAAREADVEVEYVFLVGAPRGLALLDLVAVMDRLLDPDDGCPWDLEQDHQSLATHLVEETWELLDAIAREDDDDLAEELGDVLMQVVFHARLGQDRNAFDVDDVATGIAEKLRRRHPHVFGDAEVVDADEVRANWDAIKAEEKPEREGPFDGVVRAMPALALAAKVTGRLGRLGWRPDVAQAQALLHAATERLSNDVDDSDADVDDSQADETVEELVGEAGLALVVAAAAHGVDVDAALRAHVDVLVGRVEAAQRRAAAADRPLVTTADWQQALDEAAAAGW
ncbi:MazG family protein [Salsipaludibacter albus]|uniref:MazG family protein n=1 Tax=Salsipaludibacter albus TaxID=2849650 RepID=UPI001EE4AA9C|nr:MazG family protein [Salsipaludibacter albus]MBY5161899.1 MazG family protein [Salsipaludibacter albus]